MADGDRTHDTRSHNPVLYQLSYGHHRVTSASRCARWLVGVEGFEPPTSCSQSRRATRLRYTPLVPAASRFRRFPKAPHGTHRTSRRQRNPLDCCTHQNQFVETTRGAFAPRVIQHIGAPGEIRTPDHQVRSLVLYPTELRARGTVNYPVDAIFRQRKSDKN